MPRSCRLPPWIVAACLAVCIPSAALADECLPVIATQPDGNYIIPGTRAGIVYRHLGGRDLMLDAWAAREVRGRPAVIVIHGGGYTAGSRVAFVGQLLEMLTDAGLPWVSVEYRLEGTRALAVEDVRAALAFVRCRAAELGVDPQRLVLLGEDSGADIALDLVDDEDAGIRGAVLVGGRYGDLTASDRHETDMTRAPRPRLLFVHGTADTEQPIETVRAMCDRRSAAGFRCDLLPVEGAIHRAENWRPAEWGYKPQVVDWLAALAESRAGAWRGRLPPRPLPDGRLSPGLHKRIVWDAPRALTYDAWLPASAVPTPMAILVHGGGWEAGDRVTYITPLFAPLARAGIAWISIDYRLTPAVSHPEQLDDVRRAVAYVRAHAPQLNIDPARLVLVGESASGQMVALLAAEDRSLAGVVSFYGVYDFAPLVEDASPRSLAARLFRRRVLDDDTRRLLRRYSPLYRARAGMPPMLLIHGTNERLWDQGVAMAERLQALGVPHELVRLDGAPHGMENWEGHGPWDTYKRHLVDWILAIRNAEFGIRN